MLINLGAVNRFVATRRPAGALLQPAGVVAIADEDLAVGGLLLEMALQAEIGAALGEQLLVHRAVRGMAGNATLANCFVLENKWPALGGVTFQAGAVRTQHSDATTLHFLRHVGPAAFDRVALVRVMAIGAAYLAFEHRMMMRQVERGADIGVTLETGRRRFPRIYDLAPVAPALDVQTSGAVAGFASHALGVVPLRFQPGMGRGPEIPHDHVVTGCAFFRPNEFRARDARRRHYRVARVEAAAREKNQGQRRAAADDPPKPFTLANKPTSEARESHSADSYRNRVQWLRIFTA
jgi:hypothetical protein